MSFKGAFTALITPFDENGDFDEEGFRNNIREQIRDGIDGLVPVGTTGECATLSHSEHKKVVEVTIDEANGEVPVIAGAGSNSTREALELTSHAKDAGADATLIVAPYYNKPTQRGLKEHYKTINNQVDIPIIVYNIPSRTGRNIEPETLIEISKLENIIGVKEASGSLKQVMKIQKGTNENFSILSGDDRLTLPILSLGGNGVISVTSNLTPGLMSELVHNYLENNPSRAKEIHYKLLPLFEALFIETNPGPVKAAMEILGKNAGKPRKPLVEANKKTKQKLKQILKDLEI